MLFRSEAFRAMESKICRVASLSQGTIIATGGGVILRKENMRSLGRSGRVIFLDRPLCELTPSADRPLTQDYEALAKRYTEREEKYRAYADITVQSSHTEDETLKIILERIQ